MHLVGMVDQVFMTIPFPTVEDANAYLESLHYSAVNYTLDVDIWYYTNNELTPALVISRKVH